MAATPEGRRLTEQQRKAQQQVRAQFLIEFLALWPLLDPVRLDDTSPGWVQAVLRVIQLFRRRSAEVAAQYYVDFRAVELPPVALPDIELPRLELPPGVERPTPGPPAARTPTPSRRLTQPRRNRQSTPLELPPRHRNVLIPDEPSPTFRIDIDESAFGPTPRRSTVINIPDIDWTPSDRAAVVSLHVTGPVNQKSKAARGKPLEVAQKESFVDAAGAASRHVLTGGRKSLLTLLQDDAQALAWARVTDGDPCSFCALLSSRGPVYKSKQTADFQAHDACACTAEPVYSRQAPWPGRSAEFLRLYRASTQGMSGKDALNGFRRAYERQQREQGGVQVA